MISRLFPLLCVLLATTIATVAEAGERIPLYPGPAPGSEGWSVTERAYFSEIFNTEVVTNVTSPSLEAFLPEHGNGTAVIIAPGGGFHALSINSEGNDVAAWLNERGVAAFVLRYRLVPSGADAVAEMIAKPAEQTRADMARILPLAGADGLAAMRLVRARAPAFGVDPDRVGFMGFSAGGAVTMHVALNYDGESRPAFMAPVYAGAGAFDGLSVPVNAPPMFIVAASDDQLGLAADSVKIYGQWLAAGRPVEMHLYASGGHGFGMRRQGLPADTWIDRFGEWLAASGFLTP
ncbi:MAG: alpha/beta hydrolase [Pseudomonadales bacterium]